MNELRGKAEWALRLATDHKPGGYNLVLRATSEQPIRETFPGAQGDLVLEAKRLLDEVNKRFPAIAKAEAELTIAER